jgi:hypothetical protein
VVHFVHKLHNSNMENKKSKILKVLREQNTVINFKSLEPDFSNIDEVYNNNLVYWQYYNSDVKRIKDSKENSIINGIIKNPDNLEYSKTKNGFELTEVDFIDFETNRLSNLDISSLNFSEQKQFNFYNAFLNTKRTQIEWTQRDFYIHYINTKRFGFSKSFIYKSNEFEKLNELLNKYKKRYDYIFLRLNDTQKIEFYNDFSDQLTKLKNKQTESKFKELIQKMFVKINNEYNHFKTLADSKIESYKKATLSYFAFTFENFKEDKSKNPFYYYTQIRAFLNKKNKIVKENPDLNKNSNLLLDFNTSLCETLNITFKIFEASYKYSIDEVYHVNEITIGEMELNEYLNYLKRFSQIISNEIINKNIENAIILKQYCTTSFKEMKDVFSNDLKIDIDNSPLKIDFDEVLKELENSINIDELKFLIASKNEISEQPQQIETVKTIEFKKELHNHIFKGNAFEVFEKYHTIKNLAENCKTDLNLLFQLFKKDNLFLETVELKHYIKWLNDTYKYSLTELKKVNTESRPNIQRTNDYKQYKESTLNKP